MAPIEHTMKRRPGGGGDFRIIYTPPEYLSHAVSAAENNFFRARNNRRQSPARPHPRFPRRKLPAIDN